MIEIKTIEELTGRFEDIATVDFDTNPELVSDYTKGKFIADIYSIMEKQGVSRTELAEKIGKSRQYVSRVLNENVNFTIDTLALFTCALGCRLNVSLEEIPAENQDGQDSQNKTISFPEKNADAAQN